MALAQHKIEATSARLKALSAPEGGAWISDARAAARARVAAMGLPHRRDEYWKYTDPAPLPRLGHQQTAWDYYLRNWRPGKPHPEFWPRHYTNALDALKASA